MQHSLLVERLDLYLEGLRERDPTVYPLSASSTCVNGAMKNITFCASITGREYYLSMNWLLTVSQTLGWIDDLSGKEFVGTESRFLRIFDLPHERLSK